MCIYPCVSIYILLSHLSISAKELYSIYMLMRLSVVSAACRMMSLPSIERHSRG